MKKIPVAKAAEIMGVSKEFVRIGLQRGILDFGVAVKMSSRWTYYINPQRFEDYISNLNECKGKCSE